MSFDTGEHHLAELERNLRFRIASGEFDEWIESTDHLRATPPWYELGTRIAKLRQHVKGGDLVTHARDMFTEYFGKLEAQLSERRMRADYRDDLTGFQFAKIRQTITATPREPELRFVTYVINTPDAPSDRRHGVACEPTEAGAGEGETQQAAVSAARHSAESKYGLQSEPKKADQLDGTAADLTASEMNAEHVTTELSRIEHFEPEVPGGTKKRGRPQTITDIRKAAALSKKSDGGSNREAAIVLYDTQYPTPQQVKNVPSILRHYKDKIGTPTRAAVNATKTVRRANKNRG